MNPLDGGYRGMVRNMIAGATIKAGQVVSYATTGIDDTVHPGTSSLAQPVGVALTDASSGAKVPVMISGVASVCEGAGGSSIVGGSPVQVYGTTTTGTVSLAATTADAMLVGIALETFTANKTARILILPDWLSKAAS